MRKNHNKNYAFIDSQNVNLSIKSQGWIIDFKKFRKYLLDKYNIGKAFMFIGYIPTNERLYSYLQESGYILIFKPTLIKPSGKPKGNVDAELVLHALVEMPNYDKALVISGDGDFFCLLDYLEQKNKLLKLMIPNQNRYSSLLRKFMPKIVFMNNLKQKIGKRQK